MTDSFLIYFPVKLKSPCLNYRRVSTTTKNLLGEDIFSLTSGLTSQNFQNRSATTFQTLRKTSPMEPILRNVNSSIKRMKALSPLRNLTKSQLKRGQNEDDSDQDRNSIVEPTIMSYDFIPQDNNFVESDQELELKTKRKAYNQLIDMQRQRGKQLRYLQYQIKQIQIDQEDMDATQTYQIHNQSSITNQIQTAKLELIKVRQENNVMHWMCKARHLDQTQRMLPMIQQQTSLNEVERLTQKQGEELQHYSHDLDWLRVSITRAEEQVLQSKQLSRRLVEDKLIQAKNLKLVELFQKLDKIQPIPKQNQMSQKSQIFKAQLNSTSENTTQLLTQLGEYNYLFDKLNSSLQHTQEPSQFMLYLEKLKSLREEMMDRKTYLESSIKTRKLELKTLKLEYVKHNDNRYSADQIIDDKLDELFQVGVDLNQETLDLGVDRLVHSEQEQTLDIQRKMEVLRKAQCGVHFGFNSLSSIIQNHLKKYKVEFNKHQQIAHPNLEFKPNQQISTTLLKFNQLIIYLQQ